MKKKIAVLLILCTVAMLLAGCGSKLEGTYVPVNTYSADFGAITFNGENVSVSFMGYNVPTGTYKIEGNKMILTINLFGSDTTQTMSYSKKGNSIFLDGQEYKNPNAPDTVEIIKKVAIFVGLLVLALIVIVVGTKVAVNVGKKVSRSDVEAAKETIRNSAAQAGKAVSTSAAVVSERVTKAAGNISSTVSAGVSAGAAAIREERAKRQSAQAEAEEWEEVEGVPESEEWEEVNKNSEDEEWEMDEEKTPAEEWEEVPSARCPAPAAPRHAASHPTQATANTTENIKAASPAVQPKAPAKRSVTATQCCICGAALDPDAVKLFDHPSGAEARICKKCHSALYVLASSKDIEQFDKANQYLRSFLRTVDPVVENSMNKFLQKAETRVYSDMMKF